MELIKKYRLVIAIILPILILILFRAFGANHFQSDAKRWAKPSVLQSNIITGDQIGTLPGEKLIINLDGNDIGINEITRDALKVTADSILDKNILNTIRKHAGPVIVFSSEAAVSARIWMLLSQMGHKNIFILSNNTDNEVFKYKFRPDTLARPEF
jgi:hypothetical protein